MSKTIKQIASELGVSRQAVYQKIKRNEELSTCLQPFTTNVDSVVYISKEGEKLIKSAFSSKCCKQYAVNVDSSADSGVDESLHAIIEVLQSTIATLQGQLTMKDEQIRVQQEQLTSKDDQIGQLTAALKQQTTALESTTSALAAAQALHAADKKSLMLIEEKENEKKMTFWERRAAKRTEKSKKMKG